MPPPRAAAPQPLAAFSPAAAPGPSPLLQGGAAEAALPLHHSPKGGRSPGVLALDIGAGYRHGVGATGWAAPMNVVKQAWS